MMVSKKKATGRPTIPDEDKQVLVPTRYPPELVLRMDKLRRARGTGMGRSTLIREYVAAGVVAEEAAAARKKK